MYNFNMKGFLSHFSSAIHWDIPYIEAVIGTEISETDLVDITVFERFAGADKKCRIHLCELNLPVGAVISKNGKMVASPELLFLQLANKLDIHRLILLGLQLCSHPPGKPSKAITTKQKLKSFLAKTSGHWGHRKALRAAKF